MKIELRELSKDLQDLANLQNRMNRNQQALEWVVREVGIMNKEKNELIDRMVLKNMSRRSADERYNGDNT